MTSKALGEMEAQFRWGKKGNVREGNEPDVNWWEISRSRSLGEERAEKECAILTSC